MAPTNNKNHFEVMEVDGGSGRAQRTRSGLIHAKLKAVGCDDMCAGLMTTATGSDVEVVHTALVLVNCSDAAARVFTVAR